jgi:hypothetical protein
MADLCADQGYEETTVEQLIGRAQVSEADFNGLFSGGKEEVMIATINTVLAETVGAVSGAYSQDRAESESALIGVRSILELMAAKPSYAYLSYISARQMAPEAARAVHEAGIKMLAVMLERLWEYSASPVQPKHAAIGAVGGAEAVVRREIVAGRVEQLPRLLPDFIYGATVPFLGQGEAMRLAREGRALLARTRWADD